MKRCLLLLLLLSSCTTPVYVPQKVYVPVVKTCKVHLPVPVVLSSQGSAAPKSWQEALDRVLNDVKVLKEELMQTRKAAEGCDHD